MLPLRAALKLLRPLNLLQGAVAVLVAAALMPSWPAGPVLLRTVLVLICFTAAANALNDWFDYPIDRINRPERPLAAGDLSRPVGLAIAVTLFLAGIILVLPLPPPAPAVALTVALPLLILYTPLFKRIPLAGNIVVALVLGLAFLFSGAAFGNLGIMWPPFGLAAGFTLLRELVKDIEDLEGDQAGGALTFPVKFGTAASIKLAQFLTLALMMAVLLPYILGVYGTTYLVALIVGVELPLLYSFNYITKHPDPGGCKWIAKVLKIDIFFGLLAVYLSKFDV